VTSFRAVSAALVLWAGCLSIFGAVAATMLAEAIVVEAARPLAFPVELGAALSELRLGTPRDTAGG
jgi:hypothetical protein